MNNPVAHGAIVLAISLATVGAVVSADHGQLSVAAAVAGGLPALQSEAIVPTAAVARSEVPVRNGSVENDTAAVTSAAPAAQPVKIQVAAIGLEADVIPVGVDQKNQFDVPVATTVGWYRHGPSPGRAGASVLAAHVDYKGAQGAFYHLSSLAAGDRVDVVMDDGSTLHFEVTGLYEVQKKELPAEELFRKDGAPVLHLITCGGTFDPQRHSYNANVVVTAEPVGTGSLTA
jgi:sortase (surface protein transpeptidase)